MKIGTEIIGAALSALVITIAIVLVVQRFIIHRQRVDMNRRDHAVGTRQRPGRPSPGRPPPAMPRRRNTFRGDVMPL